MYLYSVSHTHDTYKENLKLTLFSVTRSLLGLPNFSSSTLLLSFAILAKVIGLEFDATVSLLHKCTCWWVQHPSSQLEIMHFVWEPNKIQKLLHFLWIFWLKIILFVKFDHISFVETIWKICFFAKNPLRPLT